MTQSFAQAIILIYFLLLVLGVFTALGIIFTAVVKISTAIIDRIRSGKN